jgi:hypothetical protein
MLINHLVNDLKIAEVSSECTINSEDIMDLMAEASYNGCNKMILHAASMPPEFFDLKTRIAGEILQKFSNYRMKLAIVGDFSAVKSKSLNDFIRESNKWKIITFVDSIENALT